MTTEFQYKQNADGIQIEYELIPFSDLKSGEKEIDDLLAQNEIKIQKLTKEIQDLSVNCDNWDYSIAALSGVITGLIDIFFVGGIDLDPSSISEYHEIGKEGVEKAIKKAAKMTGFKNEKGLEGNELIQKSIEHLQNNFNLPADQATSFFGGGLQHHLRDFAHHPTLFGLVCSILSQLTGISIGTNTAGVITFTRVTKYRGKNIFEQLFFGIFYWMLHLLSDIDGTSFSAGKGTGIPGVLLSLLKEMDGVRNLFGDKKKETADELSVFITKLFNGSEFSEIGPDGKKIYHRFDYRTELGIVEKSSKKMAIPVIINECVVRVFYLVKHLILAIKEKPVKSFSDFKTLNWRQILPFNNASITRMLTISIGTMEAIDITDATIHGIKDAAEMGESIPTAIIGFLKGFLLHVNYVGVGRFAISLGAEAHFKVKREGKISERIAAYDKALSIMDAKLYFREADMWISAFEAGKSIDEAYNMIEDAKNEIVETHESISNNLELIGSYIDDAEDKNPGLKENMLDILKWGI